ncbi:MAG TPA: glycerophosphodiester phosphodiesterase [Geodermatophilus sp.]|nr:glycerophosphodiester phosphodiesterase [Geodermatophilus sp.]
MDFADLRRPFVIAHRGGALQVPEHTMEGYRVAVGQGLPVIEQDVHRLADGGLGVMHDGTVDRMTTSSGNVADHTSVSWKQLDIDASATLGGGWPDGLRPPLFDEVLTEFGNRVLLCAEAKSSDAMGPVIDALHRRSVDPATVLLQSFALADCRLALAAGYDVIWLGTTDVARAAGEGIGWIGAEAGSVTAELCARAHAAGIAVATHTVNRRHHRDALVAAGVDAIFSDDPLYLAGDTARRTRDLFARQVWLPGMLADTSRGRFHADDSSWGHDLSEAAGCTLMGYLAPPDPAAFTLRLDLRIDGTGADGRRCSGWVLLSTDDSPYRPSSPSPGVDGYLALLRADGVLEVQRVTDGVVTGPAASTPGPAPPTGTWVPLRITVTGSGLSATAGTGGTVDVADDIPRPVPVVHLGSACAAVRFREVEFT